MGTNETEYKMGNTMFLINKQTNNKHVDSSKFFTKRLLLYSFRHLLEIE